MTKEKNVLVIGASGGVAGAFFKMLAPDRGRLADLTLVDSSDGVLRDPTIPHDRLGGTFRRQRVDAAADPDGYRSLLQACRAEVVIDLSVNETRPMLARTDAAGACYLNTGIANRIGEDFAGVVFDLIRRKADGWKRPHILCAGMNPGIVNLWVRQGIEAFGVPRRITHFECDDGRPEGRWRPLITWSRETFVDEIANDPSGYMAGRGRLRRLYPNPLKNRVPMDGILAPLRPRDAYPRGFLLLHEENLTIAQRYDVPSRFVFANDRRTMDELEARFDRGELTVASLCLGDNRDLPIRGEAMVGVRLEYDDRWVYRYNVTDHGCMAGSSGSCRQVAAGLHAALFTLLGAGPRDRLGPGIHFCEDLFGTSFEWLAEENLHSRQLLLPAAGDAAWPDMPDAYLSSAGYRIGPSAVAARAGVIGGGPPSNR